MPLFCRGCPAKPSLPTVPRYLPPIIKPGNILRGTHYHLESNKVQDIEAVKQGVAIIRLINSTRARACGVVLWVVLVVRLLITRLQNHASFSGLQEEINNLPQTLKREI